jgi:uncharacterized protein YndB with AHSA1/START domain
MTTPVVELDFRVGGKYRMVMKDAQNEYPFDGKFLEIVANERIVFDAHIYDGVDVTTTVTFADDDGGKTLLTVRQTRPANAAMAKGQTEGWSGQLEKLDGVLR